MSCKLTVGGCSDSVIIVLSTGYVLGWLVAMLLNVRSLLAGALSARAATVMHQIALCVRPARCTVAASLQRCC